jgi:hypothetical protein
MNFKNLSLAFYSAIFAAFFMKLADKFKMSFRGAEPVFHDYQPPYTAVHFMKTWKTGDGRIRCDSKSVFLGPELKTREHMQKLYEFCRTISCTGGYEFSHTSTISWELPPDVRVGDVSKLEDIMTRTDILHIVGRYYELLGQEGE